VAYNPYKKLSKVLRRADMILGLMRKKGVLTEEEYRTALAQPLSVGQLQRKVDDSIRQEEAMPNRTGAVLPDALLPAGEPAPVEPVAVEGEGAGAGAPAEDKVEVKMPPPSAGDVPPKP
jgi:monofunctional biosynthetic peptidoglycan transglycosylase